MTSTALTRTAIEANMAVLAEALADASAQACDALAAMRAGNRNVAIGTILPLEQSLPDAMGLVAAILALNRR